MMHLDVSPLNPQSLEFRFATVNMGGADGEGAGDDPSRYENVVVSPITKGPTEPPPDPYPVDQSTGMVSIQPPDFSGKNAASDTWAWITRAQWADYLNRFAPREEQLLGMSTYANPALAAQEIDKAKVNAGTAFDASARMQEQYAARYGAGALSGQAEAQTRSNSIGKSAAIVDAANRISQKLIDQNRAIAVGAGNSINAIASQQG